MIGSILVPVDGSAHALAAAEFAAELAQATKAKVVLLNVMTRMGSFQIPEELRDLAKAEHVSVTEHDLLQSAAERIVAQAADRLRAKGVAAETAIEYGDPAAAIVDAARKRGVGLIAMGRRGLGTVKGLLLGSVTSKVMQLAECPCVVVK